MLPSFLVHVNLSMASAASVAAGSSSSSCTAAPTDLDQLLSRSWATSDELFDAVRAWASTQGWRAVHHRKDTFQVPLLPSHSTKASSSDLASLSSSSAVESSEPSTAVDAPAPRISLVPVSRVEHTIVDRQAHIYHIPITYVCGVKLALTT